MVFSITFWPGLAVITTFLVAGAVNVKYELNNIGFLIVDKLRINYYKMKYFDDLFLCYVFNIMWNFCSTIITISTSFYLSCNECTKLQTHIASQIVYIQIICNLLYLSVLPCPGAGISFGVGDRSDIICCFFVNFTPPCFVGDARSTYKCKLLR